MSYQGGHVDNIKRSQVITKRCNVSWDQLNTMDVNPPIENRPRSLRPQPNSERPESAPSKRCARATETPEGQTIDCVGQTSYAALIFAVFGVTG